MVFPVATAPTWRASTTATRRPDLASNKADGQPGRPAPTTRSSTVSVRGSLTGVKVRSSHSDSCVARDQQDSTPWLAERPTSRTRRQDDWHAGSRGRDGPGRPCRAGAMAAPSSTRCSSHTRMHVHATSRPSGPPSIAIRGSSGNWHGLRARHPGRIGDDEVESLVGGEDDVRATLAHVDLGLVAGLEGIATDELTGDRVHVEETR